MTPSRLSPCSAAAVARHARVRLHVHVSPELPDDARQRQFRRRIPLELTAEQLALLEREEKRFGTKRATLVAGLEALARLLGVEAELEQAVRERDEARSAAQALAEQAKKSGAALAKTKQEAGAAKRAMADVERKQQQRGVDAQAEIDGLRSLLEAEEDERRALERELDRLEAEALLAVYCPRCAKWAKRAEWAAQRDGKFEFVYHERCGFHPDDGLRGRSVVAYRQA
jgi:hypothetical protein